MVKIITSVIFGGAAIFCLFLVLFAQSIETKQILSTNSKTKIDEIQKFLDDNNIASSSEYFYQDNMYNISIDRYSKDYDKTIKLLVNSDLLDNNIVLFSHRKYFKAEKYFYTMDDIDNWLKEALLKIDGVDKVFISNLPLNAKTLTIDIIPKNYDIWTIKNINDKANRFLAPIISNKDVETIIGIDGYIINDDALLFIEAKKCYMDGEYIEAIKILQKLQGKEIFALGSFNKKRSINNFDYDIKLIKEIIEINNEIAKNPTNYELYIKRGDIEKTSICDFKSSKKAVEDYTKAIELNQNADDAYKKRATVHYEPILSAKLPLPSDKFIDKELKKAALDLEKAVEITGGDDLTYYKLSLIYKKAKKQKEAKKWYDKIQNKEKLKDAG